ncbi:CMGC/CDK/CRK7 protein kinase [Aphanomyces invadans]|uniref:Cyclin-dependent kinase 2 homolog n=1 Tax=Aphanomyces invadans TaxID=157072 RepID=A0A024U3Z3_9STRA|nr:CMGC/CDK/CRK7 protein kinase [Aphanomyces invadans]ETW00949.1 CMGC/CDK/CRK7 protein kinase [Aphanomyces invadans]|eukprot:XP_008869947.1 CMGC/CDK/CRK7 protein kinase [Aphanomyces invadans]
MADHDANSLEYGTPCFEKYTKVRCIGAGTYGRVYEAKDRVTGDVVALKKIKTLNESEGVPVTTLREIVALKSLRHPNLVEMKGIVVSKQKDEDDEEDDDSNGPSSQDTRSDYANGSIFLVLEFVAHDLTGLLQSNHTFSELATKYIMRQLLEGLKYMHDRDVLHRDLKTSNILLTPDYVVKLADYGLARTLRSNSKLTNKVVTLWYRAPELLLGSTEYDASVDMWSVGCVFAELFLGRPLFAAKTETEQMVKIIDLCGTSLDEVNGVAHLPHFDKFLGQEKPRSNVLRSMLMRKASERNVTLPKGFVELLDKLLQLDPKSRFNPSQALNSDYFHVHHPQLHPKEKPTMLPPIPEANCHEMSARKLKKEGSQAVLSVADQSKKKLLHDKANAVLSVFEHTKKRPPSKPLVTKHFGIARPSQQGIPADAADGGAKQASRNPSINQPATAAGKSGTALARPPKRAKRESGSPRSRN